MVIRWLGLMRGWEEGGVRVIRERVVRTPLVREHPPPPSITLVVTCRRPTIPLKWKETHTLAQEGHTLWEQTKHASTLVGGGGGGYKVPRKRKPRRKEIAVTLKNTQNV